MMPREQNTPAKQAAKAACKALVRAAGGLEAAAEFSRPNKSVLGEYGRPEGDCFMPIDVVEDLEAITHGQFGHPIVTRHLAARAGYALIKLPSASDIDDDWLAQVGKLVSDSSMIIQGISKAAADKDVSARDVREFNLIGECDDLLALVVNMRAQFQRIEAASG